MIRVYALKTWLAVRNFYNKQKYNLLVYKDANKFLKKWKRFSPQTFDTSKQPPPLNDIAAALVAVSPLPVPKNTITDIENIKMILPETTFPVEEQSKDYSGH